MRGNHVFEDHAELIKAYRDQFKMLGSELHDEEVRAKVVGHRNLQNQRLRFNALSPLSTLILDPRVGINIIQPTILDVGCGLGDYAKMFPDAFNHYTGVDILPEYIATATMENPSDRCTFINGDFLDKEFQQSLGQFDVVVASGMFAYYDEWHWTYIVSHMWNHAIQCVAFNILTSQTSSLLLQATIEALGCKDWVLQRTTTPPDYTVYMYKPREDQ